MNVEEMAAATIQQFAHMKPTHTLTGEPIEHLPAFDMPDEFMDSITKICGSCHIGFDPNAVGADGRCDLCGGEIFDY